MTSDQGPQGFVLPVRVQRCWSVGTFTTADALRRHFTESPFIRHNLVPCTGNPLHYNGASESYRRFR